MTKFFQGVLRGHLQCVPKRVDESHIFPSLLDISMQNSDISFDLPVLRIDYAQYAYSVFFVVIASFLDFILIFIFIALFVNFTLLYLFDYC